ncbi:MAG: CCA tRNA nucleotidyltransferase [Acidobacteria bacterium]|nr:CCA tRNA nucleotidyltransferase [Acidobacteriota bacterium]MBV9476147.1 CCA tRNA nucleotidyltransferase [Acidobacteriota bacterium]
MKRLLDLPTPQRRAIDLVKEVAAEKDCHPYLVGGPVRDLLLGRSAIDVDLTLEDGSSTLARALAKRVEGRVRSFPQFLTYKVTAEGLPEIDIATARKERYRRPGALPAVTAGRLKDDLLRRDFSINAIAMDLDNGALHDPADGEADIERRVIRVLHDRSFLDDPTRIFRAIRLATRLGFTIEPHTASLMREAIEGSAFDTVAKERLWRELFLAMDEPDAPAVLATLVAQGALAPLFGNREHEELRARLERVGAQLAQQPEADRYVLYTGVLLRGDASPVDFEGSGFSQKRARAVVEIANEFPRVIESVGAAETDAERFRIYRGVTAEMLTLLAAERAGEGVHIERFREFEKFKLPLRGNDLEVPGGPHVAQAIERTRVAVWNGEIPPEEARSYARKVAKRLLEDAR